MDQAEKLRVQGTTANWARDAEGRIIEFGVVRLPDRVILDICATEAEAKTRIDDHYVWKGERREAAEQNRRELDSDELPPTNYPWMYWEHGAHPHPPVKDMEWELRRRTVTDWEPLTAAART